MREILKMGLILLLITSVSGVVLGAVNSMTAGIIEERAIGEDIASMQVLVPEADNFSIFDMEQIEEPGVVKEIFEGLRSDEIVGYAIKARANGYGGPVEIMVGIDSSHTLNGVEVLSHSETPGLGDKITESSFREQFTGHPTTESLSVDTISSATVSSEAVIKGVEDAINLYENYLRNP